MPGISTQNLRFNGKIKTPGMGKPNLRFKEIFFLNKSNSDLIEDVDLVLQRKGLSKAELNQKLTINDNDRVLAKDGEYLVSDSDPNERAYVVPDSKAHSIKEVFDRGRKYAPIYWASLDHDE